MKRVTGIGGIFFKAQDAAALQAWYKRHLGIDVQTWVAPLSRGPTARASRLRERPHAPFDPEGNKVELWEPIAGQ